MYDEVSLGLWVDNPRSEVLKPDFMTVFAERLQFDLMAIMIDRMDKDPAYQWKANHVEEILELADHYCVEIVLTTWPYPDKQQIDAQVRQMTELMNVGPIAGWEVDLEFNWKDKQVHGFQNLDKAGDYLVEKIREVCAIQNARFEMTSFTQHRENSERADVGPEADRLLVQAYSISNRNDKPVGWNGKYGPGGMQKFTLDRTVNIPGVNSFGPRLGVGLAAWSQRFKNHKPEEAMAKALEKAMTYNPIDIRWWSSKHVIGRKANPYAFEYLQSLRSE